MKHGSYAVAEDGESNLVPADRLLGESIQVSSAPEGVVPDAYSGPMRVSSRLLAARAALGLTASEIAVRTRVTLRHIEALETGSYSRMPGRPYAIGFARAYARAVGLNDAEIAEAVRSELEGSVPRPEPRVLHQFEVGDPAKTPSRLIGWLALLLVGALLAMGGILWRSYYAPSVALPSLVAEPQVASVALESNQRQLPKASTPAFVGPVVFTAQEEGVWVKFYDGQGKQLMQRQLAKGESYTVPDAASGPKLWTGRPDALSITIGGRAIPRLSETERVMKDVPVDAASLRARPALNNPAATTPLTQ